MSQSSQSGSQKRTSACLNDRRDRQPHIREICWLVALPPPPIPLDALCDALPEAKALDLALLLSLQPRLYPLSPLYPTKKAPHIFPPLF